VKTLLLLRHAKSSWKDAALADGDRPLAKRGRKDAPRMGALLADQGLVPDRILTSTALRARETARLVAEAADYEGEIEAHDDLYLASPAAYLEALRWLPDDLDCVLCVGHNPGLEDLVAALGGSPQRFPTAALAHLELDTDVWRHVASAPSRLVDLWRPRELD
jgi:phosphohistidine phosphatase